MPSDYVWVDCGGARKAYVPRETADPDKIIEAPPSRGVSLFQRPKADALNAAERRSLQIQLGDEVDSWSDAKRVAEEKNCRFVETGEFQDTGRRELRERLADGAPPPTDRGWNREWLKENPRKGELARIWREKAGNRPPPI